MCGIYGIVGKTAVSRQAFIRLGMANQQRGNRTFGYATASVETAASEPTIHRFMTPFHAQAVVGWQSCQVALGHNGTPTNGGKIVETAVHPFASRSLLLAHNGLLLNHTQSPHWRPAMVDSEVILAGIQAHLDQPNGADLITAITQTVSQLDGQQACWLWHQASQQLYLWRVMSPLFVFSDGQSLHFSSVRLGPIQQLLDEGIVYQFEPATGELVAVESFPFYSPYKT